MKHLEQTSEPTSDNWMNPGYEPGLVSVIVPTYNRAHLITDSLDSVHAQTYRPIELLIVDDGSTDDTSAVVRQWIGHHADEDFTVRFFERENNGAPAARNYGLIESRGEFIQFLDSDDLLHPEKVERQTRHLCASNADFTWANCGTFTDNPIWPGPGPETPRVQSVIDHITRGGHVNTVAGIYRRSTCMQIGQWNEDLRVFQDREYNVRLFLHPLRLAYQSDVLVLVRREHGERISGAFYSDHLRTALRAYEHTLERSGSLNAAARDSLSAVYFSHALQSLRQGQRGIALQSVHDSSRLAHTRSRCNRTRMLKVVAYLPLSLASALIEMTSAVYKWWKKINKERSLQQFNDLHGDKSTKVEC